MVPVSRPLLDLVRERITRGLEEARRTSLMSNLGLWLGVIEEAGSWNPSNGLRKYLDVAEAGAVLAATGDEVARASFEEGIAWLRQRRFFVPGQPASLEADPIALVGLAVGLDAWGAAEDARTWLNHLICEALSAERDVRRVELLKLAKALAGRDEAAWSTLSPVIQAAMATKGKVAPTPEIRQAAIGEILNTDSMEPEWAVLQAAALDTLFAMEAAIDLVHPTIEQVTELLKRVSAALKRWPWEDKPKTQHKGLTAQRWDIQNEYHVQSLIWAILRPVFPALEDEENLPSLGHKHPRADLLVPGLRLVIEVKYLRTATQAARAQVIEEVAADAGLYLTEESAYDRIIVFIWDDTASTQHHDEIVAGIRKLNGIDDVVIVSRPGDWKASDE